MKIFAGTSGFAYREWRGVFYPPGLKQADMLPHYAGILSAVEINATFYRFPRADALAEWGDRVPPRFVFAFKAPAVITHRRRLDDVEVPLRRFLEATAVLEERRGPLLFQLPPSFTCDLPALKRFLPLLRGTRAAVEFRHPSWFVEPVYEALREASCALCVSDREEAPPPPVLPTAPFGYLRLRRNAYTHDDLARWHNIATRQKWQEAFFFFRHEETASGPRFAMELLRLMR